MCHCSGLVGMRKRGQKGGGTMQKAGCRRGSFFFERQGEEGYVCGVAFVEGWNRGGG